MSARTRRGKDTRGPVNVPVDAQFYHALANEAAEARISLYALVAQKFEVNGACCSRRIEK